MLALSAYLCLDIKTPAQHRLAGARETKGAGEEIEYRKTEKRHHAAAARRGGRNGREEAMPDRNNQTERRQTAGKEGTKKSTCASIANEATQLRAKTPVTKASMQGH